MQCQKLLNPQGGKTRVVGWVRCKRKAVAPITGTKGEEIYFCQVHRRKLAAAYELAAAYKAAGL